MFGPTAGGFGFGQTQAQPSPFGAAPAANPFGASAFGQQPASNFGAPATGGMFGQAAAPAFGAAPTPAFGGASAFGAPKPAFGAFAGAPAFGAATQPAAFGVPSTPPVFGMQQTQGAFGMGAAAPAFGATSAFGASSAPAFGAASAPAFGAAPGASFGGATNPFGGTSFGGTTPAFGSTTPAAPSAFGGAFGAAPALAFGAAQPAAAGSMFGASFGMQQQAQQQAVGTRAVPYQKTAEKETSAQGASSVSNYITITAMPAYAGKSQEELRWEDYQQGVKSAAAGPPQQQQQPAAGLFGAPASPSFGAPAPAPSAFGAPAPAFGVAPAFGASTFGTPATASAFGAAAPTGAFGGGSSIFGTAAPAFGQASQPSSIFNSAPSFASAAAPFGAAPAPAPASSSLFSFNTAGPSTSLFGAASQPAAAPSMFGATGAANPFGPAASPFSSAASSLFGTAPAFGSGGAFGAKPAAFSFNSSPAASSGFAPLPGFAGATTSPGLFSSMPSFAPAATAGAFGFNNSPNLFGTPGQNFAMPGAAAAAVAPAQGPAPTVGQTPYGSFPSLPAVSEPKVGISARPFKNVAASNANFRGSPLLSLRSASATPKFGVQLRSTTASPLALISAAPATFSTTSADVTSSSQSMNGGQGPTLLPTRANPHRLFIREPPPGTEAASASSPILTPTRPRPAAEDRPSTPDGRPLSAQAQGARYGNGAYGATNGASPRQDDSLSRQVSDALPRLGRLAADGYIYEPSTTQLEAMYQSDPASIKQVMNFTVARRGVGQVRWLKPVDVTSLALDRIVIIQQGEVCCYTDDSKPPVGQGLNTDAEITLYNIYKLDRETQQPIRDGPAVLKWEKTLRTMCAKLGAKFVFYKADGGVWKFEVEHFSRYGLLDLDEDDDEEEQQQAAVAAARKLPPGVRAFGLFGQGLPDEEDLMEDEDSDALADRQLAAGEEEEPATMEEVLALQPAAGSALQHNLPSQLNLDPARLMAMHESFFAPVLAAEGSAAQTSTATALQEAALARFQRPAGAADVAGGRARPQHLWRRGPGALTSTADGTRLLLMSEPSAPAASPVGGAARMSSPRGAASPGAADRGVLGPGPYPSVATSACYVDAGLTLGSSFRVGWGPGGKLVFPGNVSGCHVVCTNRVLVEGPAADGSVGALGTPGGSSSATSEPPPAEQRLSDLRSRLRAALEIHLQHSSPELPPSEGDGTAHPDLDVRPMDDGDEEAFPPAAAVSSVPAWSLKCNSRGLMHIVAQYVAGPEAAAAKLDMEAPHAAGGSGAQDDRALLLCHEVEAWRLVQALWGHIDGEDDRCGGQHREEEADGADSDCDVVGQAALAGFRRRRAIGHWLRRQAKALAEAELSSVSEPCEAVLRLLCAQQPAAAAAVAVAAGDVRLATLLALAGDGARAGAMTREAEEQLSVWRTNDMLGGITRDRLLVYRLLAGQVDEVRDRLCLDWRRYLGLVLWYVAPASASPARAVHLYQQAMLEDTSAPRPQPIYMDERATLGRCRPRDHHHSQGATDLHHELLCLWAAGRPGSAAAPPQREALAALLQAAAYSSNPLDGSLAWHVMTLLQAVQALPRSAGSPSHPDSRMEDDHDAGQQEVEALLFSVHINLVTQLRLTGGMCEWAVYAALHVPDVPDRPGLRSHLVRELLSMHCSEWRGDASKLEFLTRRLMIPQEMLAEAEAVWAKSRRDDLLQCSALLAAGQWGSSHTLLVSNVAPALFLAGRQWELLELLQAMKESAALSEPEWHAGGALYLSYLMLVRETSGAGSSEVAAMLLLQLQAACDRLAGEASAAASKSDPDIRRRHLRRRLVHSHMAQTLHRRIVAEVTGATEASYMPRLAALQGVLSLGCLPSELRMAGVAAAVAAVSPILS